MTGLTLADLSAAYAAGHAEVEPFQTRLEPFAEEVR